MKVVQLWRYPVKSLGGERQDEVAVNWTGLEGDRRWGVVDRETGVVLTARRERRLLFASARLVAPRRLRSRCPTARWVMTRHLSRWLERPVTVARAGESGGIYESPVDFENESDWVSWQGPPDARHDSGRAKVSIFSTATVGDCDVRRFRPNVLVEGDGEDGLVGRRIEIGGVMLDVKKQLDRCVMVTRAQPGLAFDLDVLRTINRTRSTFLAIGAQVVQPGRLAVGDAVRVADDRVPG